MGLRFWASVLVVASALSAGETASAQVNFAHNYLKQPCCGGDLLRGVRASITMNDLDTAGAEAVVRVIARASENLTVEGAIQAGYTVTNNVYPDTNQICNQDTGTGQPYQYWASQPITGGEHFCHLAPTPTSPHERHHFTVMRVSGSPTYWRVYRNGVAWSSTRDVGFDAAGFVGGGGRLTSDDALNQVNACYGCGSNPSEFRRTDDVCCSAVWEVIQQSWRQVDPGWTLGQVPSPFVLYF